jgi:hypothetical protein
MVFLRILLAVFFLPALVCAEEVGHVTYQSEADQLVHFSRVGLLDGFDNTNNVYAKALTDTLENLLMKEHRFEFVQGDRGPSFYAEEFEKHKGELATYFKKSKADAALQIVPYKTKDGFNLTLTLYLAKDLKPLAQETKRSVAQFDFQNLEAEVTQLYRNLFKRLPFDGIILSRQGEKLTVNLGSRDGLSVGKTLTVVQIVNIRRHPKLHFVVSSDQVILGSLRVTQVDAHLAFAHVLNEVRPGSVQAHMKVSGLTQIEYKDWTVGPQTENATSLTSSSDQFAFGEDPKIWNPDTRPSFGMVGASFGIGQIKAATQLTNGTSIASDFTLTPRVSLYGEAWITPEWSLEGRFLQGIATIKNPRPSSGPSDLSLLSSRYDMAIAYRHSFMNDFFGPYLVGVIGFSNSSYNIDSSSPRAFTSVKFSNIFLAFGGEFPLTAKGPWYLGGRAYLHLSPKINETPVSSGASSSSRLNEFHLFSHYQLRSNIRARGSVEFSLLSIQFSGAGSRPDVAESSSIQERSFNGALEYLF